MSRQGISEKTMGWLQDVSSHSRLTSLLKTPPLRWLYLLDGAPKPVALRILSFASVVMEPTLLGKGVKVEQWSSSRVGMSLPDRLTTRGIQKQLPLGTLIALSQTCFRLYWEWQMGPGQMSFQMTEANWSHLQQSQGRVSARYSVEPAYKDQCLFQLQSEGVAEVQGQINLVNEREQLMGTIDLSARLEGYRRL